MDAMTIRRGTLYSGAFLIAAGAVTLGVASGALDRTAVANTVGVLWPLAVIAVGAGLVLRRSPAAFGAGVLAAALPGLALGASLAAAPNLPVPCTDGAAPVRATETRDGSFGSTAAVNLTLNCGELAVSTQPGTAWRLDAREGDNRRTDLDAGSGYLTAASDHGSSGWGRRTGRVEWDVILPTATTLDLATELNAGRGRLDLAGAHLGVLDLSVNAGELHVDLTEATLQRLLLEVNAGSAGIVLPAASFEGDLASNAGALEVCAPVNLGLRVRSTAALGSIHVDGLTRRDGAWETPGYDTAPFKADLAVEASVGSVTINPVGGCK
jgi:hypothetical protein